MTYLNKYSVLSTTSIDEFREGLMRADFPHAIEVTGRAGNFDAQVSVSPWSRAALSCISYGDVDTHIHSRVDGENDYLLCMPFRGSAQTRHAGLEWDVSPRVGVMRDVSMPLIADQKDFQCFALTFTKDALSEHARALTGTELDPADIGFDPKIDFRTANGRALYQTVEYAARSLDGDLLGEGNPLLATQMEGLLFTQILTFLPHGLYQKLFTTPSGAAVPFYVKRVRDYIQAHANDPITLEVLASIAGCGYRTLQIAFKESLGITPMKYLRSVRLSRVRADLLDEGPSASIHAVARRWGFSHMGRFTKAYRDKFGELPSETSRFRR